jgi:hypothetical protein
MKWRVSTCPLMQKIACLDFFRPVPPLWIFDATCKPELWLYPDVNVYWLVCTSVESEGAVEGQGGWGEDWYLWGELQNYYGEILHTDTSKHIIGTLALALSIGTFVWEFYERGGGIKIPGYIYVWDDFW